MQEAHLHPVNEVRLPVEGHVTGPEAGSSHLALTQSLQKPGMSLFRGAAISC